MYTQIIDAAFDTTIGAKGASRQDYDAALAQTKIAIANLREHKINNTLPALNIADYADDYAQIEAVAARIKHTCKDLVVLGMGASGRGGSTLIALQENPFTRTVNGINIHFIENIDPATFDVLLATFNVKTTLFLAISKSGSTAETMAQLLVLLKSVADTLGKDAIKDHFVFITEPDDNVLRRIGNEHSIEMLVHDNKIGGRFSVLTSVGLLPAKVAGLDIRKIRQGASSVVENVFNAEVSEPAKGAALHQALYLKGKTVSTLMPYCDRLNAFSSWHQQLWAESLGKNGHGTTALRALGAFDQHSQLQLYLDGPDDKFTTLILLNQKNKGAAIPPSSENALSYLKNRTIGDLMAAEQLATRNTLISNKRAVRSFELEALDEFSLGALLMHFMFETMIMAHLWDINPFDQPAVEEGKILAREYMANG